MGVGSSQPGVTECHVHSQHSSWKIHHLGLYGIPLVQCETNSFGSPGWEGQDTGKCYQHTTTPHSCPFRAQDHKDPTHGLWVVPPKGKCYMNQLYEPTEIKQQKWARPCRPSGCSWGAAALCGVLGPPSGFGWI